MVRTITMSILAREVIGELTHYLAELDAMVCAVNWPAFVLPIEMDLQHNKTIAKFGSMTESRIHIELAIPLAQDEDNWNFESY